MMDCAGVLEAIYREVKLINRRLELLEDLMEEIIVRELSRVRLSDEEIEEIRKSVGDMKRGEYVTLGDLERV